jgi:hypothetical protein
MDDFQSHVTVHSVSVKAFRERVKHMSADPQAFGYHHVVLTKAGIAPVALDYPYILLRHGPEKGAVALYVEPDDPEGLHAVFVADSAIVPDSVSGDQCRMIMENMRTVRARGLRSQVVDKVKKLSNEELERLMAEFATDPEFVATPEE